MSEQGIVMLDCQLHGPQYDRDWCPFCRIDELVRELTLQTSHVDMLAGTVTERSDYILKLEARILSGVK